jgi:flagellar assembly factor FliW
MTERGTVLLEHPLARGCRVEPDDLWSFPEGLIGVPQLVRFARVPLAEAEPFELLASVDDPAFGIVLVDPRHLVPDYVLSLSPRDLAALDDPGPESVEIRVPVVLPADGGSLGLNLKGPIVFAPRGRVAVQRISRDEAHPVRFVPNLAGTGATSCSS